MKNGSKVAVKISESELCWEFLLYCDGFRVSVVGKLSVLQEHGFWQQQRDIWAHFCAKLSELDGFLSVTNRPATTVSFLRQSNNCELPQSCLSAALPAVCTTALLIRQNHTQVKLHTVCVFFSMKNNV